MKELERSRPPLADGVDALREAAVVGPLLLPLHARLGQTTFSFYLFYLSSFQQYCIALHFFFCNTTSLHNSGLYGRSSLVLMAVLF
ncbi:hypothetical protein SUGI_0610130 [Cryptomeria japonica]|nr:hypothetical protein SUGI_0610130 [Cryptomeria japonica]